MLSEREGNKSEQAMSMSSNRQLAVQPEQTQTAFKPADSKRFEHSFDLNSISPIGRSRMETHSPSNVESRHKAGMRAVPKVNVKAAVQ